MFPQTGAISDSITNSSAYAPRSHVETGSSSQVLSNFCTCFEKTVDLLRVVRDTKEQWYAIGVLRPSCSESASQCGVRISIVVEEEQEDDLYVSAPTRNLPGPSRSRSSTGKGKRKIRRFPVKLPRNLKLPGPLRHHKRSL